MASAEGTCCPASSLGYLASDTSSIGEKVDLGDGVEFYQTGASSSAVIILFPDVWGWDSGRTRLLADEFGHLGYRVYVPKLLQPALEGGTDGDGLPPSFNMGERGGDFKSWVIQIPWNTIEPKLQKLMSYAKEQGAKSFGTIGCCWGGWAAFHASAMSADISCGVIFHPSCQLEGMFGGDVGALCKSVQCPFYFMPANGDSPELYGSNGSLVTILAEKFGPDKVRTKLFADSKLKAIWKACFIQF